MWARIGLLTAVVFGAQVVPAFAEDTTVDFSGFYLGVYGGGALASDSYSTDPNCQATGVFCATGEPGSLVNGDAAAANGTGVFQVLGAVGGAQVGANMQNDNLVFGLEGDIGRLGIDGSKSTTFAMPYTLSPPDDSITLTQSVAADWLATLRGRIGTTVTPDVLLYVTGGVALADLNFSSTYSDTNDTGFPGGSGSGSWSGVKAGWTVGAGGEWLVNDNMSLKAEYLYVDFGKVDFDVPISNSPSFTQTIHASAGLQTHVARIGLNIHID